MLSARADAPGGEQVSSGEKTAAGERAPAPVLEYSSGSFSDFIMAEEPETAGTAGEAGGGEARVGEAGAGGDAPRWVPARPRPGPANGSGAPSTQPMDLAPLPGLAAGRADRRACPNLGVTPTQMCSRACRPSATMWPALRRRQRSRGAALVC